MACFGPIGTKSDGRATCVNYSRWSKIAYRIVFTSLRERVRCYSPTNCKVQDASSAELLGTPFAAILLNTLWGNSTTFADGDIRATLSFFFCPNPSIFYGSPEAQLWCTNGADVPSALIPDINQSHQSVTPAQEPKRGRRS